MLRHTRLIPRDVVVLGNAICDQAARAAARGEKQLSEVTLRRSLGRVARGLADEQLRICANQIAADQIPAHGARQGLTGYFIGSNEYSDGVATQLVELLIGVGKDRFDHATVMQLERSGRELLKYEHILDVLWHNGILGYDTHEPGADHAHFYDPSEADDFHLPADKASYVLHPCLPHLIRLEHVGSVPVRGFRRH